MQRMIVRSLAMVAALVLVAGACSSKTDNTPSSGGTTSPPQTSGGAFSLDKANDHGTKDVAALTTVSLELDDRYFESTFLKATAGQSLAIQMENAGEFAHTFTIPSLRIDETFQPGDKRTVTVTVGQSDVAFYCRFHVSSGMWGAFFLGSSPTVKPSPA